MNSVYIGEGDLAGKGVYANKDIEKGKYFKENIGGDSLACILKNCLILSGFLEENKCYGAVSVRR